MKSRVHFVFIFLTPILLGVLAGISILVFHVPDLTLLRLEFLLNTIISCSTTISGFILASVSIIIGAPSSKIMAKISAGRGLTELRCRYTQSLILGLIVVLFFSYLGAIIDDSNCISTRYLVLSAGLLFSYLCSVMLTCYFLLSIIGLLNKPAQATDETPSASAGNYR